MPILKDRLTDISKNQAAIAQQVQVETIRPTDIEKNAVDRISRIVAEKFRDEIAEYGLTESVKEQIRCTITEEAAKVNLDYTEQKRIERIAIANVIGLGAIEPYMQDNTVTEVIVQRFDNICVEREGIVSSVDAAFTDENQLRTVINRIVQPVGRQINLSTPMVDARLPDGSRVNATIPPVSPDGATLTIRKFPDEMISPQKLIDLQSATKSMMTFLALCVQGKVNIIVSGGTSTGKTTLLNILSSFIPENELIITIEDSCELRLSQNNVRRLEARTSLKDSDSDIPIQLLVRNALRMRPDRIVVGEVRDGTIVDMMSAMSTGHDGSLSTIHANSPQNLVNSRIPILYSMNNNVAFSEDSQALQIAEAVQLIVHISRMTDGSRRISQITHVSGVDRNGHVKLKDVFQFDPISTQFHATGYIPRKIIEHAQAHGVTISEDIFTKTQGGD